MEANSGTVNPALTPARLDKEGNVNVAVLTPAETQKISNNQ